MISIGFDLPAVEVAILARPTLSTALYIQQAGRVLRPSPGKTHAIILDHAANSLRHGLADRFVPPTSLSEARPAWHRRKRTEFAAVVACKACASVFASELRVCPECGEARYRRTQAVYLEGELRVLDPDLEAEIVAEGVTPDRLMVEYRMLRYLAEHTGLKPGAAYYMLLDRYRLPRDAIPYRWSDLPVLEPDEATRTWFVNERRRRAIAFHRRNQKEREAVRA